MSDPTIPTSEVPAQPQLMETANRLVRAAPPPLLFHYTNQTGVLGILSSGSLRATAIRFLNDSREYDFGLRLIAAELKTRVETQPDLQSALEPVLDLSGWQESTVGVVSFSAVRDDLSQWRAYSGGSGGIAIGFDGPKLMQEFNRALGLLVPVKYGNSANPGEHQEIVRSLCDDLIDGATTLLPGDEHKRHFQFSCTISVQIVCSVLKDWAFRAESEWRGIVFAAAGSRSVLQVRAGHSTLVPYYDVSLRNESMHANRLPVGELLIGPTPHPELARLAASTLLGLAGEQQVHVALSDVPFRDW